MPYWFQFSKNARTKNKNKDRKYEEPNNSTMNRICKSFEDIGNINLNYAGVHMFNWQMLMSGPCTDNRPEIPILFCDMDNRNMANVIESQEQAYSSERQKINGIRMTSEDIVRVFTEKFGSLENAYPYVTKYLFGGEGMNRSSHKQMFWNVFGNIALENIKKNLKECRECQECGMKIPSWVQNHVCVKNTQGFYECVDCGVLCERTNARQFRCPSCQETYKRLQKRVRQKGFRTKMKENKEQRIGRLGLSSDVT